MALQKPTPDPAPEEIADVVADDGRSGGDEDDEVDVEVTALGGLSWAATMGTLGYVFSASVSTIKSTFGIVGAVALVLVVVLGIVFVRRAERRLFAAPKGDDPDHPAHGHERDGDH